MLEMRQAHSNFRDLFEELKTHVPAPDLRGRALDHFLEMGFPSIREEDWKYTNVRPIAETAFSLPAAARISRADLPAVAGLDAANRLVYVNGIFNEELSATDALPSGAVLGSIAGAEDRIGTVIDYGDLPFAALNSAFFADGALVHISRGVIVEEPIYLIFVNISADGSAIMTSPRVLIIAEEASQATVVETHMGLDDSPSLINSVLEAIIGDNAVIEHCRMQLGSERTNHISALQTVQGRASSFKTTVVTLGGGLVRNDARSTLDGEGCEATMNGLYIGRGKQHIDNHTRLEHTRPHCPSHELYKGILDDKSSAVFNGQIIVRQEAQKTDSKQSNMNLLLTDDAIINTKPQLEIFADDVRCTHGATIGRLDENAMFYLRSRGIDEESARNLLIYAFASDVIERIGVEPLRIELERMLFERFAQKPDDVSAT